jgi:transcriptional regulator with XRE-family HTH domain
MAGITQPLVRNLGDYIREQRRSSQISLRQLARLAGVSNPYLSQIERGLRKPSAQILQQIAKALRISAEALYVQAGILEYREGSGEVVDAVHREQGLTERQKQVLIEIYDSFRKENDGRAAESDRLAAASALSDEPGASPADEAAALLAAEVTETSEAATPATTARGKRSAGAGTAPKPRRTTRTRAKVRSTTPGSAGPADSGGAATASGSE